MFQVQRTADSRWVRYAILGLLIANVLATAITVWIMIEVRKEQIVFAEIMEQLRRESDELATSTRELSYELRWQYGLTIVVLLNIVASGLALLALSRAYLLSQRSLRSVKELAANILASMDHAVLTVNPEGILNGINPKGRHMLGIEPHDLQKPFAQVGNGLEPLIELNDEIQERGETIRDRAFPFQVDGQACRFLSHGHLLKDEKGATIGTVLHVSDITEQSRLEERMRRMERFAGLGAVAAGLAHEIKNPLSALALHAQLLKEQLAEASIDDADETIGILLSEVRRMNKVLDGFREFASINQLDRQPVVVTSLLEKVTRLLKPHLQSKGVSLELGIQDCQGVQIAVDSVKIEQVLINLMLNALEAMPGGGTLTIRCQMVEQQFKVSLIDTGAGIPQAIQGRLFDPYFTTKDRGTGLGLAICEKIIRQHEGGISFETSAAGTAFHLVLPVEALSETFEEYRP